MKVASSAGLQAVERRLILEEAALGALLEQLRGRIPRGLLDGRGWERVLERARSLPATSAARLFGFEFPLHSREPDADLGVLVTAGSRAAASFANAARREGADPGLTGPASLLAEIDRRNPCLRAVENDAVVLEYDIGSAGERTVPTPGLFLAFAGRGANPQGAVDVLVDSAGWTRCRNERREVERVCAALDERNFVRSIGVFPSRKRGIRLLAAGFEGEQSVGAFLERIGWTGSLSLVAATVGRFRERKSFAMVGVNIDVSSRGVGPGLGISLLHPPSDDAARWAPVMDGLREDGLAVAEKLTAMAEWPGTDLLFGRSGVFLLSRRIGHVKLALSGNRIEKSKLYALMSLFVPAQTAG